MVTPIFPSLSPSYIESNALLADKCVDEEAELALMEKEHQNFINEMSNRDNELTPCGQTDAYDEDDDEEDDDNDDDESDSNDDDDDDEIGADDNSFIPSPVRSELSWP